MPITGFRTNDGNPFAYLQVDSGQSMALGLDTTDSNKIKLATSSTAGVTPLSPAQITIDPAANGDVTLGPNGSGSINAKAAAVVTTGGVVQAAITTGALSASKGTDGELLIGDSAGTPAWGSLTSPLGTISIAYNAGNIELDGSGTGLIQEIRGNNGTAVPVAGVVNIQTANTTVSFDGAGDTLTLDFSGPNNLALGSSQASITSASHNTSLGLNALNAIIDAADMTAVGYHSLQTNQGGNGNTAIGSLSLLALNNGSAEGYNTAIGAAAGYRLATGSYNALVGPTAGGNYTGAESSNILINHEGILGENNTLRIGLTTGGGNRSLTSAYICGIDGVNVGSVAKVLTMASDQIGTASITAGTGISVTPGANTITIASTATAFTWTTTAGGTAGVNTGYFTANGAALVTITLPAVAAVGNAIRISGLDVGGWKLAQNAGQSVNIVSSTTTVGVGGSLASTARYDSIEIVCCVANTTFNVVSSMGNITIV
jgi:hypothetical protein